MRRLLKGAFAGVLALTVAGVAGAAVTRENTITTSIGQVQAVASWLPELLRGMSPQPTSSLNPGPGYWTMALQSYCLDVGRHGPDENTGYLVAPLQGERAGLVQSVISKAIDHPEIDSHDVQVLIWSINETEPFNDLPSDLQDRVRPLLSNNDIKTLNEPGQAGGARGMLGGILQSVMPSEVQNAIDLVKDFREKLRDPSSTFEDIAGVAVPSGMPGSQTLERDVSVGTWSNLGGNMFVRVFPDDYTSVKLEVLDLNGSSAQLAQIRDACTRNGGGCGAPDPTRRLSDKLRTLTLIPGNRGIQRIALGPAKAVSSDSQPALRPIVALTAAPMPSPTGTPRRVAISDHQVLDLKRLGIDVVSDPEAPKRASHHIDMHRESLKSFSSPPMQIVHESRYLAAGQAALPQILTSLASQGPLSIGQTLANSLGVTGRNVRIVPAVGNVGSPRTPFQPPKITSVSLQTNGASTDRAGEGATLWIQGSNLGTYESGPLVTWTLANCGSVQLPVVAATDGSSLLITVPLAVVDQRLKPGQLQVQLGSALSNPVPLGYVASNDSLTVGTMVSAYGPLLRWKQDDLAPFGFKEGVNVDTSQWGNPDGEGGALRPDRGDDIAPIFCCGGGGTDKFGFDVSLLNDHVLHAKVTAAQSYDDDCGYSGPRPCRWGPPLNFDRAAFVDSVLGAVTTVHWRYSWWESISYIIVFTLDGPTGVRGLSSQPPTGACGGV